ncbi:hypothetical protein [Paenibacillus agricola]|uniref:Uncharacterized protein n=1 Tax=Paenibacillus agricola TaxID=2716264 RepID=A0ABX0JG60_9BACL|nr:hypothetical protein [Paenibacillus agricola]NHN35557.1 hypothetical protein [Paenibacillus agricola]
MKKAFGFELGKAYFCDYWRERFLVTAILEDQPIWDELIESTWQDGSITKHRTARTPRDHEITIEEFYQYAKSVC